MMPIARVGSETSRRQQHHAPAEHPDHAGEDELRVVEVERPRRANHRELEHHEQQAARHEVRDSAPLSPATRLGFRQ